MGIGSFRERVKTTLLNMPAMVTGYIIISLLLIIYDSIVYPRGGQHDSWLHLEILKNIYSFRFTETYNGILYYILVALLSAPIILLYKIVVAMGYCSGAYWINISVLVSGSLLWIVFFFGLYNLYIKVGFKHSTAYLCAAATAVLPPILRSYIMIRPENLILSLSPYLFIYGFKLMDKPDSRWVVAIFCLLASLSASQKVTGLAFLLWALVAILIIYRSSIKNIKLSDCLRIFSFLLILFSFFSLLNYFATGGLIFNHHANLRPEYVSETPTFANIFGVDLISVWKSPLRNEFPISLINIFSDDLFGDYWGFGINHNKLPIATEFKIIRSRIGLVLTGFFVATFAIGLLYAIIKKREHIAKSVIVLSLTISIGILVLVLASLKYWNPAKGDTYKWEYVIMFMIFAYMPLAMLVEKNRIWGIIGYLFVAAGLIQSTILIL